jgi:hypothetical protein
VAAAIGAGTNQQLDRSVSQSVISRVFMEPP